MTQKEQKSELDVEKAKQEWWNKGYVEGRKNAHIPAKELGLPKSMDFHSKLDEIDKMKYIAPEATTFEMPEIHCLVSSGEDLVHCDSDCRIWHICHDRESNKLCPDKKIK